MAKGSAIWRKTLLAQWITIICHLLESAYFAASGKVIWAEASAPVTVGGVPTTSAFLGEVDAGSVVTSGPAGRVEPRQPRRSRTVPRAHGIRRFRQRDGGLAPGQNLPRTPQRAGRKLT